MCVLCCWTLSLPEAEKNACTTTFKAGENLNTTVRVWRGADRGSAAAQVRRPDVDCKSTLKLAAVPPMIKSQKLTKTNQPPEEQASVPSKTSAKFDLFSGNVTSMLECSFSEKNRTHTASKVLVCHNPPVTSSARGKWASCFCVVTFFWTSSFFPEKVKWAFAKYSSRWFA